MLFDYMYFTDATVWSRLNVFWFSKDGSIWYSNVDRRDVAAVLLGVAE